MVFTDFNFFWIEYDKWGHFIMNLVGFFMFHKNLQFDLNCIDLQMSPKRINVLRPWTLNECRGCNEEYFYACLLMDTPLESTTIIIVQVCWMLVVV
jgi:hypothetical protein